MSCERMESRILAYVDGRLSESEFAEVQKHLDACPVCRVRATEFSSVSDLLDELPLIEPSPAFDVRVRAPIAAYRARRIHAFAGDGVYGLARRRARQSAHSTGTSRCGNDARPFRSRRPRHSFQL